MAKSREKRKYYGDKHKALRKKIQNIKEDYYPIIFYSVSKAVVFYKNNKTLNNDYLQEIIELSWDFLTEIYKITSYELKQIYREVPDFTIESLQDFLYNKDGKSLEERIEAWYNTIPQYFENESKNSQLNAIDGIYYHIELILNTEAQNIETAVKKNKVPTRASLLIIEAGCGDLCQGGEYAYDEDVDLPPFHPNCQCLWYFEETDDEDEAHDLDLEVDEV